ncbi:SET domain protein [Drechmeria coniospora]|uniref:SET domain protein n=1 Tax=Drechmeria coniospora TaxID=98403 RepID=A0A151GUL4_DRECN|nr:SET domain protein [Drechmeria coniospora]KYK60799.1 SET domain protein [Drechmeria coniospora]ODA83493.1 hypothetical protein RJ55_02007 [Drechmeria coniospora]
MASFQERTDNFLRWFKSLPGAFFSDAIEIVDLRARNAGRGIIATRNIPAETTLFTIPRRAIISVDSSRLRELLPSLFESQGDGDDEQPLDSWSGLIMVLIHEHLNGDSSAWRPYFGVLPETFDTPMFWSDDELSELQASAMRSKIGKAEAEHMFRTKLLPAFRQRPDIFPSSNDYSDEQFFQMAHMVGSTIMAYAFDLENDEAEEENGDEWVEDREGKSLIGMVPMADILNADAEFNVHVNHGDDSLTVTTLRRIHAGEEIMNYYGPHPNSELLRRYGYVTEKHSRHDVVEIPWLTVLSTLVDHLGIPQQTLEQALERIDDEELEDSFVLERGSAEPNSEGTFVGPAAIEEMPADLQEQLKLVLKSLQKMDESLLPDKRKRDEALQAIMLKTILTIESWYSTTSAEDERLLLQNGPCARRNAAVLVRLGEKRLLNEAKEFLCGLAEDLPTDGSSPQKRARRDA